MDHRRPVTGEPKRIAIVSSSATALVLFRGPLITEMRRRGHRVAALAPDFTDELRAAVAKRGAEPVDYRLDRTGSSLLGDMRSLIQLWRILSRLRPDVVLSHFIKPVIYGTMAASFAGVPRRVAMIEGLGMAFTDTGETSMSRAALRMLMQFMLRVSLKRADRIIFLNEDDHNELVGTKIADPARSTILGGIGLHLDEFPFSEPPVQGPPIFVMIARLLKEKGVFEFVEAARRVRARLPRARFLLVGGADPKPGSPTMEMLRSWVGEGLIEWPGMVDDVRPYLRQATVFVLPSYREGLPRSTQEAMAIGRAVITTDVPGCRATVEPGVNGLIVAPRDVDALAGAMERLANDTELVAEMGRRSRAMAEARFDVDKVNRRLLELLAT